MNLGGYSATGPRDANEDSFYAIDFSNVESFENGVRSFVMISDGMGGYQGGDVASGIAVSCAERYLEQLLEIARSNRVDFDARSALAEIARNAHEAIVAETRARGNESMGATFVGAFVSPSHAWIGHVGDSRAYLVRNSEVVQLTEDHSQVGRMLFRGLITEEEAQVHPARNRIERALGFSNATPEINEVDLEPGDALMLCSDGVYTVLDSNIIGGYVNGSNDAEDVSRAIVKAAIVAGTDDNSTAVVAYPTPRPSGMGSSRRGPRGTLSNAPVPEALSRESGRYRHTERSRNLKTVNSAVPDGYGRSARPKISRWTAIAPLVVLGMLLIALAIVFLTTGNQEAKPDDTGIEASSSSRQAVGAVPQQGSSGATGAATYAIPQTPGYGLFETVEQLAVLKYVGSDDMAYQFNAIGVEGEFVIDTSLAEGASVSASSESKDYGRPGREYRALNKAYRDELISDAKAYRDGETEFNSNLSKLIEPEAYQEFLGQLIWSLEDGRLEQEVMQLVVDAGSLQSAGGR